MNKYIIGGILVVIVAIAAGLFFTSDDALLSANEGEKLIVGATIFPVYDIARTVAGDDAEVVLLLPPGTSPHTFEIQPSVVKDLQGAEAVFAIGHELDTWTDTIADSVGAPVITVDEHITLRAFEGAHDDHDDHDNHEEDEHEAEVHHDDHHDEHEDDHAHEHEHEHGEYDPHYWLSVHNGSSIAHTIAHELAALDPANEADYEARAEAYEAELEQLHDELITLLQPIAGARVLTFHDAWAYFAEEFNLNIVGSFTPSAGKEPTPQYLADLQREVLEHNISVIFSEPQLSNDSLKSFAKDNSLAIAVLDPLGGAPGRETFVALMRYNVQAVLDALR